MQKHLQNIMSCVSKGKTTVSPFSLLPCLHDSWQLWWSISCINLNWLMWVGFNQSVEGLKGKDWGFPHLKEFLPPNCIRLKTVRLMPARIFSLPNSPSNFRLASPHNRVIKFLKISLSGSLILALALALTLSLSNL